MKRIVMAVLLAVAFIPAIAARANPGPCLHGGNIVGTAGNDHLCGGNGADVIRGLGGNDVLAGNHGPDVLYGGAGNDSLWGGRGPDRFYCGPGHDVVHQEFPTGNDFISSSCEVVKYVR